MTSQPSRPVETNVLKITTSEQNQNAMVVSGLRVLFMHGLRVLQFTRKMCERYQKMVDMVWFVILYIISVILRDLKEEHIIALRAMEASVCLKSQILEEKSKGLKMNTETKYVATFHSQKWNLKLNKDAQQTMVKAIQQSNWVHEELYVDDGPRRSQEATRPPGTGTDPVSR